MHFPDERVFCTEIYAVVVIGFELVGEPVFAAVFGSSNLIVDVSRACRIPIAGGGPIVIRRASPIHVFGPCARCAKRNYRGEEKTKCFPPPPWIVSVMVFIAFLFFSG